MIKLKFSDMHVINLRPFFLKQCNVEKKIKDAEVEVLKQIHNIYNKAL